MLFPFLYLKRSALVGLDIQDNEIFLIKIKQLRQEKRIETVASLSLPPGVVCDGKIIEYDPLASTLGLLVQQTKTQGDIAAVAIPRQHVMSKQLNLPPLSHDGEYEAEIHMNLDKYLPGVTGDIYFDYCFMEHETHKPRVQFVAARHEMVNAYLNVVNQSGLRVKIIDVDCYAIARAIRWCAELNNKTVGVLDVGLNSLRIMYLQDANIIFTHHISLDLQSEEVASHIVSHVKHTIQMCSAAFRPIQVERIYLMGNFPGLAMIFDMMKTQLTMSIEIPNFLSYFNMSNNINEQTFTGFALRSLVSLGLALRGCPVW